MAKGSAVWWIVGGIVVIGGGGVGAYFLLRKKENEVGAVSSALTGEGGGGGGGGGGGDGPSRDIGENRAYGLAAAAAGIVSSSGGQTTTTAGLAAHSLQLAQGGAGGPAPITSNVGSMSLARDTTTIGGREMQAGAIGRVPTTGLAGVDTTSLARSRSTPVPPAPAPTGPTLVRATFTKSLTPTNDLSGIQRAPTSALPTIVRAAAPATAPAPTTLQPGSRYTSTATRTTGGSFQ